MTCAKHRVGSLGLIVPLLAGVAKGEETFDATRSAVEFTATVPEARDVVVLEHEAPQRFVTEYVGTGVVAAQTTGAESLPPGRASFEMPPSTAWQARYFAAVQATSSGTPPILRATT